MNLSRIFAPLLAVPLAFSIPSTGLGEELLPSGNFENLDPTTELPVGWGQAALPQTREWVEFSAKPGSGRSGKKSISASISVDEDYPAGGRGAAYNWMHPIEGLEKGKLYVLDAWVRTKGLQSSAFLMLQCFSKKGQMLGGARYEDRFPIVGDQDWTHVASVFEVPEGTENVMLRAGMKSQPGVEGTV